jgi:DNA-directed RNA polymerase subunit omega
MDKKTKIQFTNENLSKKFKNNFELVNYAIQLAENMIKTGRDTRVRSDLQNRAMLILEEINEGKDQFDEIQETTSRSSQVDLNGELQQPLVNEEQLEKRKYRTVEAHDDE